MWRAGRSGLKGPQPEAPLLGKRYFWMSPSLAMGALGNLLRGLWALRDSGLEARRDMVQDACLASTALKPEP